MKKLVVAIFPLLLASCSYYNTFLEKIHTDTLTYQCDEKPLAVERHNNQQQVVFVYNNRQLTLTQGLSASGERYTDGVYVFWAQGDTATVYRKDNIVLHNCQLQQPKS